MYNKKRLIYLKLDFLLSFLLLLELLKEMKIENTALVIKSTTNAWSLYDKWIITLTDLRLFLVISSPFSSFYEQKRISIITYKYYILLFLGEKDIRLFNFISYLYSRKVLDCVRPYLCVTFMCYVRVLYVPSVLPV